MYTYLLIFIYYIYYRDFESITIETMIIKSEKIKNIVRDYSAKF